MKKAILLVSHGSYSPEAKREVLKLKSLLKRKSGTAIFKHAFLEINRPNIPAGITACVKKGATDVIVLLNFLNSGEHVRRDIPRLIRGAKKKYPHVSFRMSLPIGQQKKISDLFIDLVRKTHLLKNI